MIGFEVFLFGFATVVYTLAMLREYKEKQDLERMMEGKEPEQPEAPVSALWNYIQ